MERTRRKEPMHLNKDFTKPVDIAAELALEMPGSCFGKLWDMTHRSCALCSDNEMCGVVYSDRQDRVVKKKLGGKKPLDSIKFDNIQKEKLMMWLSEPRPAKDFADLIQKISECDDRKTVVTWVKSFIIEEPRLIMKNSIIYCKNK